MAKKTIKELIEISLDFIEKEESTGEYSEALDRGLCFMWDMMVDEKIITVNECGRLLEHLENNPPQIVEMICSRPYTQNYYWKRGDFEPRKKYLKEQLLHWHQSG